MRLRKLLTFSALALALSVSLTGCGRNDEPLTEAQMQRKMQEQQLAAQQQRMDLERAQARADLASQQARDQALIQQQQAAQGYQQGYQQPQQYNSAPAQAPAQHADGGIGAGTAILGAAAVGTAGYLMGRGNSNNNTTYNNSRPVQQPATRVIAQPATRVYQAPAQPAYKASVPVSKPAAGFTRMSSTKRR